MLDVCNDCSTDKRKRHDNVDERLRVAIDLRLCRENSKKHFVNQAISRTQVAFPCFESFGELMLRSRRLAEMPFAHDSFISAERGTDAARWLSFLCTLADALGRVFLKADPELFQFGNHWPLFLKLARRSLNSTDPTIHAKVSKRWRERETSIDACNHQTARWMV